MVAMLTDHGASTWQNMAPASSTVSPAQTPTEQNIFGLCPSPDGRGLFAGALARVKKTRQTKKAII